MNDNLTAQLELIRRAYLGNPFSVGSSLREQADTAIGQLPLAKTVGALLEEREVRRAKELVLSVGHQRAQLDPSAPSSVLGAEVLPGALFEGLPRHRGAYLRIVVAAGRAYRGLCSIFGGSDAMQAVRRKTWAACFGDSLLHSLDLMRVIRDHDILVLGETGTGKELLARAIQAATPGSDRGEPAPNASLNAAAIPETLVESELFGHVKGAFTGATETRAGRIRTASGGCLFLDEVGDLPTTTQVKLLRVIETNQVYPLGADRSYEVDVRYVAATHKDLIQMVEERSFRQDLFERLAGNIITIPPLRDRPEDITEIGTRFVEYYAGTTQDRAPLRRIERWLRSARALAYPWPGNVRELQNALRNLLLGLDPGLRTAAAVSEAQGDDGVPDSVRRGSASLEEVNDWYLARVLDLCGHNYAEAARILGVDRSTVRRRAKRLT